jgi:hypothetical protein
MTEVLILATGERTRRNHLVPLRELDGIGVAICQGMTAPTPVQIDLFRPLIEQVTCANCRRIAEGYVKRGGHRERRGLERALAHNIRVNEGDGPT